MKCAIYVVRDRLEWQQRRRQTKRQLCGIAVEEREKMGVCEGCQREKATMKWGGGGERHLFRFISLAAALTPPSTPLSLHIDCVNMCVSVSPSSAERLHCWPSLFSLLVHGCVCVCVCSGGAMVVPRAQFPQLSLASCAAVHRCSDGFFGFPPPSSYLTASFV